MFAKLGLIFLFQGAELTLIAVESLVIWLLSKLFHDFAWWIIEILWPSIRIHTFTSIFCFLPVQVVIIAECISKNFWRQRRVLHLIIIDNLFLFGGLRIGWYFLRILCGIADFVLLLGFSGFFILWDFYCSENHFFKSFCLNLLFH